MENKTYTEEELKTIVQRENCRTFLHLSLIRAQNSADRPEIIDAGISMINQFLPPAKQLKRIKDIEIPELAGQQE